MSVRVSKRGAKQVVDEKRHDVGAAADREEDHVAGRLAAGGDLVVVEQRAGERRKDDPAHGAGHAGDAGNRGDGSPREHVRRRRVDRGRPGLVRRAGESDEEHGNPVRHPRREYDRHHAERKHEHRGLARPRDAPAAIDEVSAQPAAAQAEHRGDGVDRDEMHPAVLEVEPARSS